jgi:DNA replication protein
LACCLTILDDLALAPLINGQYNVLLEIVEDCYGQSSTLAVNLSPVDKWHGMMENPKTVDAILYRLVDNADRLVMSG